MSDELQCTIIGSGITPDHMDILRRVVLEIVSKVNDVPNEIRPNVLTSVVASFLSCQPDPASSFYDFGDTIAEMLNANSLQPVGNA